MYIPIVFTMGMMPVNLFCIFSQFVQIRSNWNVCKISKSDYLIIDKVFPLTHIATSNVWCDFLKSCHCDWFLLLKEETVYFGTVHQCSDADDVVLRHTLPIFTGLGRCPIVSWDFAGAVSIFGPDALTVVHQWLLPGLELATSRVRVAAQNH